MKTHTEYAYRTRVQKKGIRIRNQFEFLIPVRYYVPIFAELQKSAHRKASMTFDRTRTVGTVRLQDPLHQVSYTPHPQSYASYVLVLHLLGTPRTHCRYIPTCTSQLKQLSGLQANIASLLPQTVLNGRFRIKILNKVLCSLGKLVI